MDNSQESILCQSNSRERSWMHGGSRICGYLEGYYLVLEEHQESLSGWHRVWERENIRNRIRRVSAHIDVGHSRP